MSVALSTGGLSGDPRLPRDRGRLRRGEEIASNFNGYLIGMAISGLGFGMYLAVDLALVVDVLPAKDNVAKDLGVFNMANALPFSVAPAIAPAILAIGSGSYGVLYAVAAV